MSSAVVYGSAADPKSRRNARDVDVAYTGTRQEAAPIVTQWMAANGLGHLPVDWHPALINRRGNVVLPAPYGQHGHYEILSGQAGVEWEAKYTLAALIRACGDDTRRLRRELRRKGSSWRLAVIPSQKPPYMEGLTELRNAVTKHPVAGRALAHQWPTLFPRLLKQDPRPTPEGLLTLQAGSPAGGGDEVSIVLAASGAVFLMYDRQADVPALLFPGLLGR